MIITAVLKANAYIQMERDKDETEKRFLWQKIQRGELEGSSNNDYPHGLTNKEGVYTAMAHQNITYCNLDLISFFIEMSNCKC